MEQTTCNIGPQQRRRRVLIGLPLVTIGIIASFWSKSFLGQVVAFFGFLSLFQAHAGTCVVLAAAGAKHLDEGKSMLESPRDIDHFKREARRIYWKSFFATLALMVAGRASFYLRDMFR